VGIYEDRINHLITTSMSTFGQDITFRPLGGSDFTMKAIFDESFLAVDPNSGAAVQSLESKIAVKVSDITDQISRVPGKGDQVVISSVVYRIVEYMPDGKGSADIILRKA